MKLISLGIKNFRSFKNEQVFYFAGPGFHFLCGDNQTESRLGANGAGKSTVFEALCWLFYGKTSKGMKGSDLCNWEAGKQTEVWLLYEELGSQYRVSRSWKPNHWKLQFITDSLRPSVDLTEDSTNILWHAS